MLLLGWVVGKGATPIDDWFHRYWDSPARRLAVVTDPHVLVAALLVVLSVALYRRRWRLAVATPLAPLAGIGFVRMLKPAFGREKGGGLAYPSGHVTTLSSWLVSRVGDGLRPVGGGGRDRVILLGMFGVGITFHYFTDTVGGLLLASAIVGIVARHRTCIPPDLTGVNPAAI